MGIYSFDAVAHKELGFSDTEVRATTKRELIEQTKERKEKSENCCIFRHCSMTACSRYDLGSEIAPFVCSQI
ncbi:hypothetical protein LINPERHAP1_LOCUS38058 [Linum perenne]